LLTAAREEGVTELAKSLESLEHTACLRQDRLPDRRVTRRQVERGLRRRAERPARLDELFNRLRGGA
jgi:hypothetical protein